LQEKPPSRGTAVIWFNQPAPGAPLDSVDILAQVSSVAAALRALGYEPLELPFSLDFESLRRRLAELRPAVVVNLVEAVEEDGRLCHLAPQLLEFFGVRFTGCPSRAMYLTTDKLLAKERFLALGIDTPPWLSLRGEHQFEDGAAYVIKAVAEDASIGIEGDGAVVRGFGREALLAELRRRSQQRGREQFAERYIGGREFNIALLGTEEAPELMPVAELLFPETWRDKPYKIFDYASKWDEASEAFHTDRCYDFTGRDLETVQRIREISARCWRGFQFKGYARADFRVDEGGRPWLLELNANPGIAPDSGFAAAVERSGLTFTGVIEKIVGIA
jgi:D-alanine-D-alanine ligase